MIHVGNHQMRLVIGESTNHQLVLFIPCKLIEKMHLLNIQLFKQCLPQNKYKKVLSFVTHLNDCMTHSDIKTNSSKLETVPEDEYLGDNFDIDPQSRENLSSFPTHSTMKSSQFNELQICNLRF